MAKGKAVVVGGLGMIGRNVIQALEAEGGWDIVGLSRRPANFETEATFISVDLLDDAGAKEKLAGLTDVTHIFYAGLSGGVEAENVEGNLALVTNSVGVIEPISPTLERVLLVQGGKYYGVHLGPHKTPSKETDPRHLPPNFYYNQQDFIADLQQGKSWNYTILRPEAVVGFAEGIPLNTASLVAVYACVCKAMDVPLNYPGPEAAFTAFNKFVDARLLGRCAAWAAANPACAGEAFNVTNASGMRWCNPVAGLHRLFRLPAGRGDADEARRLHGGQGPRLGRDRTQPPAQADGLLRPRRLGLRRLELRPHLGHHPRRHQAAAVRLRRSHRHRAELHRDLSTTCAPPA